MTRPISRRTVLTAATALGFGAAGPAARPATASTPRSGGQLAFLNHSYAVLDAETAAAISANDYLRRFGAYEERTTSNGDQTYSGRYLLGRQTYLEMFAEGDLPGPDSQRGATGLAISPDREGQSATIKHRMIDAGVTTPIDVVQTKLVTGEQIPWFRLLAVSLDYEAALPWVMEYEASYFADGRTSSEPAGFSGDVSRERYLSDTYRTRLMRDVVGLEIGVPPADLASCRTVLRAGGLTVHDHGSSLAVTGRSEVIVLRAVDADQRGWHRGVFRLNEPARRRHVERIGSSELRVGPGPLAVWTFAR